MRSKISVRHVTGSGDETVLYAITSVEMREDIMDPHSTADIAFDPLPSSVKQYRNLLQRGQMIRIYFQVEGKQHALQSLYLIESTTTTVSRGGGVHIDVHCVHPIKVLSEAQLNSSYEKLFTSPKNYTLGQLIIDVAQKFMFGISQDFDGDTGETVYTIQDLPVFETNDAKEGWQRIGKAPPANDPTATKWRNVNISEARAQNNETAYSFLARQCTRYGLILRPASSGAVMLTRPLAAGNPDYVLGTANDKAITGRFMDSFQERATNEGQPSNVYVKGQTTTKTSEVRAGKAIVNATVPDLLRRTDGTVTVSRTTTANAAVETVQANIPKRSKYIPGDWYPYKPIYVYDKDAPDQLRCENTAKLIIGLRAKEAYKLSCKLDGTADSSGTIYGINRLATVNVPELGINGEDFLIMSRTVSIDANQGQVTSLELVPKGAFIIGDEPGS